MVEIFNIMSNYILKRLLLVVDVNLRSAELFLTKVLMAFLLSPYSSSLKIIPSLL